MKITFLTARELGALILSVASASVQSVCNSLISESLELESPFLVCS